MRGPELLTYVTPAGCLLPFLNIKSSGPVHYRMNRSHSYLCVEAQMRLWARGVRLAKNDFGSVFQKTVVFSSVSVSLN